MRLPPPRAGHSLAELLTTLVLLGLLAALAAPALGRQVAVLRSRAALNRVAADLQRARMLAVREGAPVDFVMRRDGGPCVLTYVIRLHSTGEPVREVAIGDDLPRLCLRHTGGPLDSVIRFNSRGALLPPTRSLLVEGGGGDTLRLSIAGRIRRTY